MLQPGAKNWIPKYFELIEQGTINLAQNQKPIDLTKSEYLHDIFFKSGIVFGYPIEPLFFQDLSITSKWTLNESTAFLLFESLILVYISENRNFNPTDFIDSLLLFYQQYNEQSKVNIFKWLFKEKDTTKLEKIISDRVHAKKTLSNQLWVGYIHNSLVYLDVLAFRLFLLREKKIHQSYDIFVQGALNTIGAMSLIDNKVDREEEQILSIFLTSANLTKEDRKTFKAQLKQRAITISDIQVPDTIDELYKYYLIDMAILTLHTDLSEINDEIEYLKQLCTHLNIDLTHLKKAITIIERFILRNNTKISFLSDASSTEKLYKNFSKHWVKILGRSKDKFINELKENKELIALVNKSLTQELTDTEKEKVKTQFKDLAKTLPAVAIFMLPGGTILLPIILKVIPDLIPSAFRNN